jgi:phosphatidylserine/phosphatidylglycerophosphate/cardiolipin synthase-like enzyme
MREAKKSGINVQIITRPPQDKYADRLQKKQDFHNRLKEDDISIIYQKKVHAKIIVVDRAVAIVSSMNFYPDSSAGVSWEAGLISTDSEVVESMVKSIATKFMN